MSGCTPWCSLAKNRPVRQKPVCTSSTMSSAPCVSQTLARRGEERGVTEPHPALPLHDLDNHRRRCAAHRGPQLVDVVERHEAKPVEQGLVGVAVLVGRGQRAHRPAVEPAHRAHELRRSVACIASLMAASFASVPELHRNARRRATA